MSKATSQPSAGSRPTPSASSTSLARQGFARKAREGHRRELALAKTGVRAAEGKPHLFVAIDRVTKFAFVQLHDKATRRVAGDFLCALVKAVPYRIHTILTDNGTHFTDPRDPGSAAAEIRAAIAAGGPFRAHASDYACAELDIEHRLTNPSIDGPTVRSSG